MLWGQFLLPGVRGPQGAPQVGAHGGEGPRQEETQAGQTDSPFSPGNTGQLLWKDNWVTFMDTMLQMSILAPGQRNLRLPTRITAIYIHPATHQQKLYTLQDGTQGQPCPGPTRMASRARPHPPSPSVSPQWPTW